MTPEEALKNVENPEAVYLFFEALSILNAIDEETENDDGLRDWFIDILKIRSDLIKFKDQPESVAECLSRKNEFTEDIQRGLEVTFR